MSDDLGVGLGGELMPFLGEFLLQAEVVLDDAVVDNHNLSGAVAVRMGVLFGRSTMRRPSRVSDAIRSMKRLLANRFFEVAKLAFGATDFEAIPVPANGDPRRIVAAILHPSQSLDDDRDDTFLADVTNNAAHVETSIRGGEVPLFGQRKLELFNDGVGQNFAGNALHFGLSLFARQIAVQRQLKVFSLPHTFQALIAHLLEGALNGLALRIEDTFLERNVDVGCHKEIIIRGAGTNRRVPMTRILKRKSDPFSQIPDIESTLQFFQLFVQIGQSIL